MVKSFGEQSLICDDIDSAFYLIVVIFVWKVVYRVNDMSEKLKGILLVNKADQEPTRFAKIVEEMKTSEGCELGRILEIPDDLDTLTMYELEKKGRELGGIARHLKMQDDSLNAIVFTQTPPSEFWGKFHDATTGSNFKFIYLYLAIEVFIDYSDEKLDELP